MKHSSQFKKLSTDQSGASMIWATLMLFVIMGVVGLAIDVSRLSISHTEVQAAADAAALAGATQLDGSTNSITRATNAAQSTPLVNNSQRFADEANAAANVQIAGIRFLTSLPADDDDPIPASAVTSDPTLAEFVEVTTETLTHNNLFLSALGLGNSRPVRATAVAGQESAICRVTPLAICNPNEDLNGVGAGFDYTNWQGRQILVKMAGNGAAWAPGNFGLLDTPTGSQAAKDLAEMLAAVEGANQCFSTRLNTKPGQVNSIRAALNTRFDIYENPFFGNEDGNPRFAPAANVTKGRIWSGPAANVCNSFTEPGTPDAMGLPRDNVFVNSTNVPGGRFGNGAWDCKDYWDVNHPSDPYPTGCSTNNTTAVSRYDIYRYEIDNGLIPSPVGTGAQETGSPQCYTDPVVDDPKFDRRVLHFAVMNCQEHNVSGNETGVPGLAFVRAFLTEPVGDESTPGASDFDVYLEVVDVVEPGISDGPLKEYVEIFR